MDFETRDDAMMMLIKRIDNEFNEYKEGTKHLPLIIRSCGICRRYEVLFALEHMEHYPDPLTKEEIEALLSLDDILDEICDGVVHEEEKVIASARDIALSIREEKDRALRMREWRNVSFALAEKLGDVYKTSSNEADRAFLSVFFEWMAKSDGSLKVMKKILDMDPDAATKEIKQIIMTGITKTMED